MYVFLWLLLKGSGETLVMNILEVRRKWHPNLLSFSVIFLSLFLPYQVPSLLSSSHPPLLYIVSYCIPFTDPLFYCVSSCPFLLYSPSRNGVKYWINASSWNKKSERGCSTEKRRSLTTRKKMKERTVSTGHEPLRVVRATMGRTSRCFIAPTVASSVWWWTVTSTNFQWGKVCSSLSICCLFSAAPILFCFLWFWLLSCFFISCAPFFLQSSSALLPQPTELLSLKTASGRTSSSWRRTDWSWSREATEWRSNTDTLAQGVICSWRTNPSPSQTLAYTSDTSWNMPSHQTHPRSWKRSKLVSTSLPLGLSRAYCTIYFCWFLLEISLFFVAFAFTCVASLSSFPSPVSLSSFNKPPKSIPCSAISPPCPFWVKVFPR